ncbi:MAG: prepilin-type N-terminal cleavage/methylation domain-containing protein [Phycisphaerales bacterium]|nr:prepilin-type N-terminal cleavage/methylation domain-containing protein [Phycisphaerales bacterium]
MRSRRGLTLLEVLIVLALLIASAAIAIPAMSRRFESTRFDATVDQIIATLALARAQSQQQRRPVQVIWDANARTVRAAWLDAAALADEDDSDEPSREAEQPRDPADGSDERSGQDRLDNAAAAAGTMATGGSSLRVLLPEGCRVEVRPTADEEAPADAAEDRLDPIAADDSAGRNLSLAVFMPDGSTFGQASFRVVDNRGRQVRIDINPWTGQAAFAPVASAAPPTGPTEDGAAPGMEREP